MKALAFTPAAEDDLDGIWDYSVRGWGLDQAERYIKDIRETCRALASGRKRGRAVDVLPGCLKYPSGAHVIYFREGELEIVVPGNRGSPHPARQAGYRPAPDALTVCRPRMLPTT